MLDWIALALGAIRIVLWLLDQATAAKQFNAGRQAEITRAAMELLNRTVQGKAIMEKVNAMSDGDIDALIDQLSRPD